MSDEYNVKIVRFKDKVEIIKYGEMKKRISLTVPKFESTRKKSKEELERQAMQQAYRVKQKIRYYILSNDFNLFFTLTFDDSKVAATNYQEGRKAVVAWLKYQRERYGRFGYIFVPELHKSGRIHFHGVTQGYEPTLSEARHPKSKRLIKKNGKQIYNTDNWQKGFSTVSKISDESKTASYITKYLTKELIQRAPHEPAYLVSKGLNKPEIEYRVMEDSELESFSPSLVSGELSEYTDEFQDNVSIYNLEVKNGEYSQANPPETLYKINKQKIANSRIRALSVDDQTTKE